MLAPLHEAPLAYFFIATLVAVSLAALRKRRLFETLRMHPYSLYRGKRMFTVFTSVFVHVDEKHLLINGGLLCLTLPEVEYMLVDDFGVWAGHGLELLFIAFTAVFVGVLAAIQHRYHPAHRSAGASALVLAAALFFLMYFPVEPIGVMPGFMAGLLPIWIAFIMLFVLVVQVWLREPAGAVHLYGALAGVLLACSIRPISLIEIAAFVSEESDDKSARYNHATDHADDDTAEERPFPAFAACDGFRLIGVQAIHSRWND
ncbi:rhomboid family intramembrane serine protease [Parapedobacter flavus]|uniref:rhomboid family intramembrane serine protease n=1 Tax=Parapedobacter flavus TaxID=3110225 RepID=UPI002DBF6A09|nr:rhomboid family intramembrane serine protease [Parapedobacter sp. 10938]MEC3881606.1 rhomboid family intramembrane serine protease [Parapedobacter sp. 10938]